MDIPLWQPYRLEITVQVGWALNTHSQLTAIAELTDKFCPSPFPRVCQRWWRPFNWCRFLTFQQYAKCIYVTNLVRHFCLCCHHDTEVVDHTFYLPQPQYSDTRPTSHSTGLINSVIQHDRHYGTNSQVTGTSQPQKVRSKPQSAVFKADFLLVGHWGHLALVQKDGGWYGSLVVCWACSPAWYSIMGLTLLWGEFFQ